jgi:pimeloyl-ACP methyl ester carboxylesterase
MSPPRDEIVNANGVDLCVGTFGDRADPAILLIMGSSASMDWWEDEFCERLAAGSRFVIRYDLRDTGRSVSYEPGAANYTLGDLAADAVGLLDALGPARAHVVGMSMGGGIAQLTALQHPDRVASLTLVATAPAAPGPDDPDLPAMSGETAARFAEARQPDWTDRAAVIDYLTHLARVSAGSLPFDEAGFRDLAGRVFDRTTNMASTMRNHNALGGGERLRERLGGLSVPTLVIHGTEDPVVPYGNGVALAREIPGAELLTLEGMGHELPRAVWDVVVPALVEHTG